MSTAVSFRICGVSSIISFRMYGVSRFFNDCVESIVVVSGVVNSPSGAIRFGNSVVTLNYVTISGFVLWFVVSGVRILYSIFELVFGMGIVVLVAVRVFIMAAVTTIGDGSSVSMGYDWSSVSMGDDWSGVTMR